MLEEKDHAQNRETRCLGNRGAGSDGCRFVARACCRMLLTVRSVARGVPPLSLPSRVLPPGMLCGNAGPRLRLHDARARGDGHPAGLRTLHALLYGPHGLSRLPHSLPAALRAVVGARATANQAALSNAFPGKRQPSNRGLPFGNFVLTTHLP